MSDKLTALRQIFDAKGAYAGDDCRQLIDLVRRYEVSPSAMKWRLKNLEIDPAQWRE